MMKDDDNNNNNEEEEESETSRRFRELKRKTGGRRFIWSRIKPKHTSK